MAKMKHKDKLTLRIHELEAREAALNEQINAYREALNELQAKLDYAEREQVAYSPPNPAMDAARAEVDGALAEVEKSPEAGS